MSDLLTPEAFAQSIKAKYPDYASVPDGELAAKMLEKYPEYRDRVQAPDFKQSDTLPNEVDPNTVGTLASHAWSQMNPIAQVQAVGKAMIPEEAARLLNKADQYVFGSKPISDEEAATYGPLNTIKHLGQSQTVPFHRAQESYAKGDVLGAAIHFVNYLTPFIGPTLDQSGQNVRDGKVAAGLGDAVGLGLGMFGPVALAKARLRVPAISDGPANAAVAAAVRFGQQHDIPIDAGTATGNSAVKGVQHLADRSLGGSVVAKQAGEARAAALQRVGGELAQDVHPTAVMPEQAGQGVRDALATKVAGHAAEADAAYERLRELETQPTNRVDMPLMPKAVDGIPAWQAGQLRRMVHELDASGYQPATWRDVTQEAGVNDGNAGGGQYQRTPASGGAKVFHDIADRLDRSTDPTRDVVQGQIETFLAGGPQTDVVKAALAVAGERYRYRPGTAQTVSTPELPPSAMSVPTRLEQSRVTSESMGFPVDVTQAKKALQPIYDQMMRQMPITQQQASPGLKAMQNIIDGPDWAPLSQVDRDLSTIKSLARDNGGLAKFAAGKLDTAVKLAAANGGPEVVSLLDEGRQATINKFRTTDLIDKLPSKQAQEPVPVFTQATAPADSHIELLRSIQKQTPEEIPRLARAWLQDSLETAQAEGGFGRVDKLARDWQNLGDETKSTLFGKRTADLDKFFLLAKKLGENVNPSGSGHVLSLAGQMGALGGGVASLFTMPSVLGLQVAGQGGAMMLSKMLHSPSVVKALTRGLSMELRTGGQLPASVKAAQVGAVLRAARGAGILPPMPVTAQDLTTSGASR